jgi:hypothetical protein
VIGVAVVMTLGALWIALAEATGVDAIANNLEWYGVASALVAVFIGGLLAGWMTGIRGVAQGLLNGLSVWGLVLLGTMAIGIPGALQVIDFAATPIEEFAAEGLWATFWALAGGLVAAGIGGIVGGLLPRPVPDHTDQRAEPDRRRTDAGHADAGHADADRADAGRTTGRTDTGYRTDDSDDAGGDGDGSRERRRHDDRRVRAGGRRAEDRIPQQGTTQVMTRGQESIGDYPGGPGADMGERPS